MTNNLKTTDCLLVYFNGVDKNVIDPGDITEEDLKKLQKYGNCISYPVLGYISKEARQAKQEMFISNIENFLKGKPTNLVN